MTPLTKTKKTMNKNYKENLKSRNLKEETRRKLDIKEYKVKRESELLTYLIEELKFSRNNAKGLLSHHLIAIDGAPVSQFNFMIYPGDSLIISKNPIKKKEREKLPIIYEDDYIVALNKPFGLLSVASDKEKAITAYRLVMDYVQDKDRKNRIFVVHRLDKETSGVLIFAKSDELKEAFQNSWNDLVSKRGYYAIVEGNLTKKEDTITNYLKMNSLNLMYIASSKDPKAQKCITKYNVLKENKKYSLLDVNIFTGRKNQIRVTLGSLGHFVLGDDKYGEPANPINRLCLHAYELDIKNPLTGKVYKLKAPIPDDFNLLMKNPDYVKESKNIKKTAKHNKK